MKRLIILKRIITCFLTCSLLFGLFCFTQCGDLPILRASILGGEINPQINVINENASGYGNVTLSLYDGKEPVIGYLKRSSGFDVILYTKSNSTQISTGIGDAYKFLDSCISGETINMIYHDETTNDIVHYDITYGDFNQGNQSAANINQVTNMTSFSMLGAAIVP